MTTRTYETTDEDEAALDIILKSQQSGDNPPKSKDDLWTRAVEALILSPYRGQVIDQARQVANDIFQMADTPTLMNLKTLIENTSPDELREIINKAVEGVTSENDPSGPDRSSGDPVPADGGDQPGIGVPQSSTDRLADSDAST